MSELKLQNDEQAYCLFDGVCAFCSSSIRFVLAHEREPRITFVAIQSELGRQIATDHGVDPDAPSTFFFVEDGHGSKKSDGVVAIAEYLRWPWRCLRWFRFLPRSLRDFVYDRVASNRYRIFGRLDRCMVPPEHIRDRFVLPE